MISFAFLIPFIAQAFLVCLLERKKLGVPFKKVFWSCIAFPMFMIMWAIGIVWGVFSKQKWSQPKRNVDFVDNQFVLESVNNPQIKSTLKEKNNVQKLSQKTKKSKTYKYVNNE